MDHKDAGKSLPRDVESDFSAFFCCRLIYPSRLWADTFGVSINYLVRGERFESNSFISVLEKIPAEQRGVAEKMIMAALESLVK